MAQKKGRKNKASRDRQSSGATAAASAYNTPALAPAPMPAALPSRNARISGFAIAVITAFIAIVVIRDAATNGSGLDSVVKIVTGASLIVLAIVVGALVLFPAQLRDYFARRRGA